MRVLFRDTGKEKREMKKWAVILFGMLLLVLAVFVSAVNFRGDYTAVPPVGKEVDLVVGMQDEDEKAAIEAYSRPACSSAYEELLVIAANCQANISEAYFGGCYLEDSEGEPWLRVLMTDLSQAPKINHDRIEFRQVKYSEAELREYQRTLVLQCFEKKIVCDCELDIRENRISVRFAPGTDLRDLLQLVPEDAIEYRYLREGEGVSPLDLSASYR